MPSETDPASIPLAAMRDAAFLYGDGGIVRAVKSAAEELAGGPIAGISTVELVRRLAIRSLGDGEI